MLYYSLKIYFSKIFKYGFEAFIVLSFLSIFTDKLPFHWYYMIYGIAINYVIALILVAQIRKTDDPKIMALLPEKVLTAINELKEKDDAKR